MRLDIGLDFTFQETDALRVVEGGRGWEVMDGLEVMRHFPVISPALTVLIMDVGSALCPYGLARSRPSGFGHI